jgi:hypothetical protein
MFSFINVVSSVNFLLVLNEFVSKFYSFFFFAIMGLLLNKNEFPKLVLEFPILFVFSSILTFSFSTFMLERLKESTFEKLDFRSPSSFVVLVNSTIALSVLIVYLLGFIQFHTLLIVFATITASLNIVQSETNFVLRKYKSMIYVNVAPKFTIIIFAFILTFFSKLSLDSLYILFIVFNLIFSIDVFKISNVIIVKDFVLKYVHFSSALFLQQFSVFLSYYIFRFFISKNSDNNYLVEFGVLQTYLGIIYFHVSLSNRFLIFDILNLVKIKKYLLLRYKVDFSILFLSLFSFIYFFVIVIYLSILNKTHINWLLILQIIIMLASSWFYFFTQFKFTILLYSGFRKIYILLNYLTLVVSIILTYIVSNLHYDILYPISLLASTLIVFLVAYYSQGVLLYNKIFKFKIILFSFGVTLLLIGIAAFFIYNTIYFISVSALIGAIYLIFLKTAYSRISYLLIPKF